MTDDLLTVRNLRTFFYTYEGVVRALDSVNLRIGREETFGLVGETGCGKTVTALSIMRLIPPPGKVVKGEIIFEGEDLLKKSEAEMRKIRGNRIAMIFQEPMSSINPVFTVGDQISEIIMLHQKVGKKEAMKRALQMLKEVKMPDPEKVLKEYPHTLSGGMRQRALIAMELSCGPKLLIADEPTTFLDVTIQAQILRLMKELRRKLGASVLLITHDLGVIAQTCEKVGVMYAGNIVENAETKKLFHDPKHPYTKGLMKAVPKISEENPTIETIPGTVPNLINPPSGCRFHPRCPQAMEICTKKRSPMVEVKPGHFVSCFLYA